MSASCAHFDYLSIYQFKIFWCRSRCVGVAFGDANTFST
jgi:hypothetical protein